ncbi:MAG: YciI family protein [Lysobacterales bacterium]
MWTLPAWTLALLLGNTAPEAPPAPAYDAALAERLGADERGMRSYVLVILKTGPTPVPEGAERDAMFAGHFANIQRLADAGQLAAAGPLDKVDGWRGMFILAVDSIEAAQALVATDPVIQHGEMVAEYHTLYSSAALMLIPETHRQLVKPAE